MVEVVRLEDLQQVVLPKVAELDGAQPRPQQGAGVLGAEIPARGAIAAWVQRAALPCSPRAVARPARTFARNASASPAGGVSV